MSLSTIGYIIGSFALVSMFSSMMAGYALSRFAGPKTLISCCTMLIVASTFIMGYIEVVEDVNTFIALSFLA